METEIKYTKNKVRGLLIIVSILSFGVGVCFNYFIREINKMIGVF